MLTVIKIAWRNVWRNQYRSMITIFGITMGVCSLIFIRSFIDGADSQMIENYTDLMSGQVQIHAKDFQKKLSLDLSINNPQEIETVLNKNKNLVPFYSQRIKNYALVSSTEGSSGVLILGVDPEKEKSVSKLYKKIKKGNFLTGEKNEIVIGWDLAEILNVKLKDKVVLMSQGADGSMASGAYRVCGILKTGAEEIDRSLVLIDLKACQDLLVLNNGVSEYVLKTQSVFTIDKVTQVLKSQIDIKKYEILNWKEISPITKQWLEFDRAFSNVILFVVLIVVAAGILNTMLMAVLERVKEFGIMLAVGMKPKLITQMVAWESFFLGLIGILSGTFIGVNLAKYFGKVGINLSYFSNALESYYTGSVIYPRIFTEYIIIWDVIVLVVSLLASVYPARRASRLKPIEALKS